MMKRNHMIGFGLGAVALVLMTAGASAYITRDALTAEKPAIQKTVSAPVKAASPKNTVVWNESAPAPAPAPTASNCDDGNVVGLVLGAAAGGIAGSQVGKGSGKTAATIGGTLGGAYLGGEYIPLKNVTCP